MSSGLLSSRTRKNFHNLTTGGKMDKSKKSASRKGEMIVFSQAVQNFELLYISFYIRILKSMITLCIKIGFKFLNKIQNQNFLHKAPEE